MITKADLQDQIGQDYPREILYCFICGEEYSANIGDYFMCPDDYVFNCCDVPMILGRKHAVIDIVKE